MKRESEVNEDEKLYLGDNDQPVTPDKNDNKVIFGFVIFACIYFHRT